MIRMKFGKERSVALAATILYTAVSTCFIPNANAFLPIEVTADPNSSVATQIEEVAQPAFAEVALQTDDRTLVYEEVGDLYVVTDPNQSSFLKVVEKLPEGGMGRLLRFRGQLPDGKWADLEFIYEDRERTLTVLDYEAKRFYRSRFSGSNAQPFSVLPSKDIKDFALDLAVIQVNAHKFLVPDISHIERIAPPVSWLHYRLDVLSEKDVWSSRLVRGPPAGGLAS